MPITRKPFARKPSQSIVKSAGGGGRTHTPFREQDFESSASANFATPASLMRRFSLWIVLHSVLQLRHETTCNEEK